MVRGVTVWLLALVAALPARGAEPPLVVGLVPAGTEAVTRSLAAGAELAFGEARAGGGPALELAVAEGSAGPWTTSSSAIVELADRRRAVALITPPDRATAHLMAQIGTRSRVPVIATACAASVTATGSWWVVSVVAPCRSESRGGEPPPPAFDPSAAAAGPFVAAFRARFGRDPDAWAAAGYDAAAVVVEALRRGASDRRRLAAALSDGFKARGASGPIRFDSTGRRAR